MICIYYILTGLQFLTKRSKILLNTSFFVLLLLFCLNTDNADRSIYEWRLEQYDQTGGLTEPGYYYLMVLFHKLSLSIQWLYVIVGVFYISSLFYIIRKLSNSPNLVIGYYMLAVFLLDVTQLRATTSLIFVLWGFYFLFAEKNNRKSVVRFLLMVIVASLFHSSSLIFGVYAICKLKSRKKIIYITAAIIAVLSLFKLMIVNYLGSMFNIVQKIQTISESDAYKGNNANLITILLLTCLLLFYLFVAWKYGEKKDQTELGTNICVVSTTLFPMITFSADFRRVFYFISIFLVIIVSNWIDKRNSFKIIMVLFTLAFIYFYRLIFIGNYNTVLIPVLTNNLLF